MPDIAPTLSGRWLPLFRDGYGLPEADAAACDAGVASLADDLAVELGTDPEQAIDALREGAQ